LRCDIGSTQGGEDTSFGVKQGTSTFYYIGEASPNTTIKVNINGIGGIGSAVETQTITFSAPASLGIIAYVNVNGTWKQAIPWVNIGGTWKQVVPYINNAGTWK
jgi:hypothetical protein